MDYAIGDIHGCLNKVLRLLEVLRYDPATDRLIFLGDYIDRGPDSKGVLDLLLRLQQLLKTHAGFEERTDFPQIQKILRLAEKHSVAGEHAKANLALDEAEKLLVGKPPTLELSPTKTG